MKESKERNEELLKRKYATATYPIDENTEYPYNGKALIQGLLGLKLR